MGVVEYTLTTYIDPNVQTFYTNATNAISTYVTNPFTALATLALIFAAIGLIQGNVATSTNKLIWSMVTIVIVMTFALSASNYRVYIGDYLVNLPDELMAITAGSSGSAVDSGNVAGKEIDDMFTQIYEAISKIFKYGKWNNIVPYFYGGLFLVIGIFFVVVMTVAIIIVKVGVAIVATLGPLFIIGLLFKATSEFFTKWLSFALQFLVIGAILGLFIGLTITITELHFKGLDEAKTFQQAVDAIIPFYIFLPVIAVLFLMTTHFAASMTGGFAISLGGVMEQGIKQGMRGVKAATNRATRNFREGREANRRIRIQDQVNTRTETKRTSKPTTKVNFNDDK